MAASKETQLLVALQDLDVMIREAEDPVQREQLEALGFPVTGIEDLKQAQEKLREKISPQLLGRYKRLSHRSGHAIVPVVDSACTGCFTGVPSSFTSAINSGKVMNCETCGRMLYWP